MLNAIIMASGFSKRMGRNKLLLPFQGKPLIEHVLDKVMKCNFSSIILVARDCEIMEMGKRLKLKVVYNEKAEEGQSESIKLGIINSPEAQGYAFFTADQPFLNIETIDYLIECFNKEKDSIIVPISGNKRGLPVIFPEKFKSELLLLKGDTGGRDIIKEHEECVRFIEVENECILLDIDTMEDYKKLETIID